MKTRSQNQRTSILFDVETTIDDLCLLFEFASIFTTVRYKGKTPPNLCLCTGLCHLFLFRIRAGRSKIQNLFLPFPTSITQHHLKNSDPSFPPCPPSAAHHQVHLLPIIIVVVVDSRHPHQELQQQPATNPYRLHYCSFSNLRL